MKKALVIGINDYPFALLKGCVRDATDVAALLLKNGDETANFSVRLQTNVARKETLLSLIKDLFTGPAEAALFYFSGHGFINELGGYLVTPDHREHDAGISMNDILTLANNSKIGNKIIILDCCHSGALVAPTLMHGTSGHINEGITLLTASRYDEAAYEVGGKGVFTNLLLEALKGGAADLMGHITPGSVYAYIDQALGPWDQRPAFKTNVSGFVPLRTISPKLPPATLRKITEYFPKGQSEFPLDPSYEYTNYPSAEHMSRAPFADAENVAVFKALQEMHSTGLVVPVGEPYMYLAAMNSKSCGLTPLGEHYRRLVEKNKI
jgi:uncharacterized caspase-like protein